MANEFIIKNGFFSQGSSNITGSLTVSQGITGSLLGTASYASTALSSSYALTASYISWANVDELSTDTFLGTASYATNALTSSHALQAVSSSYALSSSYAISSSYALSASYAYNSTLLDGSDKNVFATTGSNIFKDNQTISGSLTITTDLVVLGSSSITYITSSQLDITTNIISVNTYNPSFRFGGLAVIDSGSSPQTSGSLLFDSQNNQWIFVHRDGGGAAVTSSVLIMGPQTFNNIGSETTITSNRLTKGTGGDLGEHIGDSNITDTGTLVSINSNTHVTGSLTITQNVSSSYSSISSNALIQASLLYLSNNL